MLDHFNMFAGYNIWANKRLYDAAGALSDAQRTEDRGAFFKSLHGTLNHILVADRVWMDRLEGAPNEFMKSYRLDTVTEPEWAGLRAARDKMDARINAYVAQLTDEALTQEVAFQDSSGTSHSAAPVHILPHFFNHQTHHRGQAHDLLHQITGDAPSLDMIQFMRGA